MSLGSKLLSPLRRILSDRSFTDAQIERLLPRLHDEFKRQPEALAEIIDTWNQIMGKAVVTEEDLSNSNVKSIPATASPPPKSLVAMQKINMNSILVDVEPDLLMLHPQKLLKRHQSIKGLGVARNSNEHWILLFNAPTGFYLQDWMDLSRKVYYIEHKIMDLLYDKKEQREMTTHPLIKSAAAVEADFDHIRTRFLFASRSGYKELSHMHSVRTSLTQPQLKDLILLDDANFLMKFAPYCSDEEYSSFANLIKNHELDEEDADICTQLAELDSIRHPETVNARLGAMQEEQLENR